MGKFLSKFTASDLLKTAIFCQAGSIGFLLLFSVGCIILGCSLEIGNVLSNNDFIFSTHSSGPIGDRILGIITERFIFAKQFAPTLSSFALFFLTPIVFVAYRAIKTYDPTLLNQLFCKQ